MNFDSRKFPIVVDLPEGNFYVRDYLCTETNYITK